MSHKLHVTINDSQYGLLKDVSAESGASIGELVRRALKNTYSHDAESERSRRLKAFREGFGAWSDRPKEEDPYDEIRAMRRRVRQW